MIVRTTRIKPGQRFGAASVYSAMRTAATVRAVLRVYVQRDQRNAASVIPAPLVSDATFRNFWVERCRDARPSDTGLEDAERARNT